MAFLKKILDLFTGNTRSDFVKNSQAQFKPTATAINVLPQHINEVSPKPIDAFDVIVVGVSFYQQALEKISCNKREEGNKMLVRAQIVPEEGNPYDSNAVRIEINGETVGHLSRTNALKWRGKMINEGFSDAVTCPAKIRWDRAFKEEGSYGVWLNVDLTLSDSTPIINADKNHDDPGFLEFLKTDGFIFFVDKPRIQDITYIGMSVNLWIPQGKNPEEAYIFHRNGPYGPIGIVPPKYSDIIISHLLSAMDYDARIVELNYNTCKIKCRLISKEETDYRKEESNASLKKELTKLYNPKKSITLMFPMKRKKDAKVGDKLTIEFEDIDSYGPYPCPWHIKFLNQAGDPIGIYSDNRSIIQRILKAHFNSFFFDIEVLEIAKERNTAWKGYLTKLVITPYKSGDGKCRGGNR